MKRRKSRSLIFEFNLILVILITSILFVFLFFQHRNDRKRINQGLKEELIATADRLEQSLALPLSEVNDQAVKEIVFSTMKNPPVAGIYITEPWREELKHWYTKLGDGRIKDADSMIRGEGLLEESRSMIHNGENIAQLKVYLTDKYAKSELRQSLMISVGEILFVDFTLFFFLMLIIKRKVIRPIMKINDAFQKISEGKFDVDIKIKGSNELTNLGKTFSAMVKDLKSQTEKNKEYSSRLKSEVENKTRELSLLLKSAKDDKASLEKQRQATINILEDISESKEELEKLNDNLEERRRELLALKETGDKMANAGNIREIIEIAYSHLSSLIGFALAGFLVVDADSQGIMHYVVYSKKELGEDFINRSKIKMKEYLQSKQDHGISSVIHLMGYINPELKGERINNDIEFKSGEFRYFDLKIKGRYLGVVQIVSEKGKEINSEHMNTIEAISTTATFTIDRLQTLVLAQHFKTKSLVESLRDGVIMFDSNSKIELKNKSFNKIIKLEKENIGIKAVDKALPGVKISQHAKKALEKGKIAFVKELLHNERFYEVYVTPVNDNYGKVIGGAIILHDITYLKEIDRMKTEFVSVASHQLRTPLTAIKLFTGMLSRGEVGELNPEQNDYIINIKESTDRMIHLVNDLLNVTRIESGRLRIRTEPVDICKFIENIVEEAKLLAEPEKKQVIFQNNKLLLPGILLDKSLIRQVVHNLITNAIRYSPPKTGKIEIGLAKEENSVIIKIKDNGIGIPEKGQKRIFQKFYRADNAIKAITEGTGLGLYMSKMIMDSVNGKIWFESKDGKGTAFYVKLPLKGTKDKEGEKGLAAS